MIEIVAITGHRTEDCEDEATVRRKLREAFATLPDLRTVIVGMANGTDLWAGDVALSMGYEVIAAKPWKGHGPRASDRELYARVIEGASEVVNVTDYDDYPGPWCYHKRNEWMVDHADYVLAYLNPEKKSGGTFACVQYAKSKDVHGRNIYAL